MAKSTTPFRILEATIDDIHSAYKSGQLTCRQLVQMYLDRIEAFDKTGPAINAIITISATALEEADRLDAGYKASGPMGTLHGIPVVLKDQVDAKGMPTTLGSVLFKNYYPDKDAFVVEKLKNAGAMTPTDHCLGQPEIHTRWIGRLAAPPAARAQACQQILPPWVWDKRVWHRYAGHRRGTQLLECGRRRVL